MIESLAFFTKSFWGVIIAAIAFVVWLVRLEGSNKMNTRRIEQLEIRICRQQDEAKRSRDELHEEIKVMREESSKNFTEVNNNILDIVKYMRDHPK